MILGERFADPEKSAYELITGKKTTEPDFDRCPDFLGTVYEPHTEDFRMIEAYLEVRRLGRPLTETELERFKNPSAKNESLRERIRHEVREEVAIEMIKDGAQMELIMKYTHLKIDEINAIKERIEV